MTVDEKHPDKPVIGVLFRASLDETQVAHFNALKHLKSLDGIDVKFGPGIFKKLKDHPTLESLSLGGTSDLAMIQQLPDGPAIKNFSRIGFDGLSSPAEYFEALAKVSSLRSVKVWTNDLKPEIVRPLWKLKKLESFFLMSSTGSGLSADDVVGFAALKELTCPVSPSESLFAAIGHMKTLRKLQISGMINTKGEPDYPLPVRGTAKLGNLTELTELSLGIPIRDIDLKALAGLKHLTHLHLSTDAITANGLAALAKLPELTSISFSRPPAEAIPGLKGFVQLKQLRIVYGSLTDDGAAAIGTLTNLESLDLLGVTAETDAVISAVAKLDKLRVLSLIGIELTDTDLAALSESKSLEEFRITSTKITAAGRDALQKKLPKLKILTGQEAALRTMIKPQ
ncbi:Alanyl-tRNA synthetase [Fimbriiglobus ruber]|uniref:Alanyl-tRNA synthetase n=1 Tax=Fimbriiglobus ruber TaxID=1908690 RepID=A0A225DNJ9_9BACT|nr:Alanyl-tRNA synthetase [Fimbriiglobus ruber]